MKLLSVVIPTLNEEHYLPILLSSLEKQTVKDFEVIVVDGNSEDKTAEKALEYEGKLNIAVVKPKKRNLSHQRNFGAEKAKGEYVVFIDADYTMREDFIQSCFSEVERLRADLIIPFSYPITSNWFWKIYFGAQNYLSAVANSFGKPFGLGPANLTKKEAFLKMGGYNESVFVYEDQYYFQVAHRNKLSIKYSDKIKMYFSLRRIAKDGIIGYFYFNFYAGLHLIFKGPVYKKFYDYQMGGQPKIKK